MKNPEPSLPRLFTIARQAPPERSAPMPAHLPTRVLACWQTSNGQAEPSQALHRLFQRAAVCAALLMLASIAWSYSAAELDEEDDLTLANLELRADVMP